MLDAIDTMRNEFIVCPYCGFQDPNSQEWADMVGDGDYDCPQCEKTCTLLEPIREVCYTTKVK